jgi:hypothetical protein
MTMQIRKYQYKKEGSVGFSLWSIVGWMMRRPLAFVLVEEHQNNIQTSDAITWWDVLIIRV